MARIDCLLNRNLSAVVVSQQVYEALGQPAYLAPFKYSERDGVMTFVLQLG